MEWISQPGCDIAPDYRNSALNEGADFVEVFPCVPERLNLDSARNKFRTENCSLNLSAARFRRVPFGISLFEVAIFESSQPET